MKDQKSFCPRFHRSSGVYYNAALLRLNINSIRLAGESDNDMKSDELLKTVQAFLGSMREGDMKGIVANLQAAMEYQAEELRIYRDKYKEATGKERPELSDDEKRRLARKGRALNSHLFQIVGGA